MRGVAAPALGWPAGEGVGSRRKKETGRFGREAVRVGGGRGHKKTADLI